MPGCLRATGPKSWPLIFRRGFWISHEVFEAQDPHEIEFIEADLAKGLPCHRGAFDLATANMMLDDCEDLAGVFATLADALKSDGRLLLSLNNPYAIVTRGKVDDYFASGPLTETFRHGAGGVRGPVLLPDV